MSDNTQSARPGWEAVVSAALLRGWVAFTRRTIAPYQAAIVRIGISLCFGGFLLREWPNRRVLYGDLAPWSTGLARQMLASNHAFTILAWSDNRWWFEAVYAAAIVVSALLLVGWRTRTMSVLFMVLVLSIQNRSVLVGDGGDNVVHLMAIYLAFTRCGTVWSLDARAARLGRLVERDVTGVALWLLLGAALAYCQLSGFATLGMLDMGAYDWGTVFWLFWLFVGAREWLRRRQPDGEGADLLDALTTMVHNSAMLVIAVEVCFIYATAGWYKIQGSLWEGGTALYFPLHLAYFDPWPGLSALLGGNSILVCLITYGTVMVQVSFPFLVFNRRIKNVLLVLMMIEHAAIAVTLGLPFFSLAMIAADAVFLPTGFLTRLGEGVAKGVARATHSPVLRQSIKRPRRATESEQETVSLIR
ncbi:HTTM domain-containing protein [Streptacidiphilus fuscans]|uniref:HTTM domain-containing protein n=1 Tax=Streptacidiphilus fuscans TaxID=2789292 RepID=UPI001F2BA30D|nr:HTTM domain-containing protein [Streptacidiphilus fuscans]